MEDKEDPRAFLLTTFLPRSKTEKRQRRYRPRSTEKRISPFFRYNAPANAFNTLKRISGISALAGQGDSTLYINLKIIHAGEI